MESTLIWICCALHIWRNAQRLNTCHSPYTESTADLPFTIYGEHSRPAIHHIWSASRPTMENTDFQFNVREDNHVHSPYTKKTNFALFITYGEYTVTWTRPHYMYILTAYLALQTATRHPLPSCPYRHRSRGPLSVAVRCWPARPSAGSPLASGPPRGRAGTGPA